MISHRRDNPGKNRVLSFQSSIHIFEPSIRRRLKNSNKITDADIRQDLPDRHNPHTTRRYSVQDLKSHRYPSRHTGATTAIRQDVAGFHWHSQDVSWISMIPTRVEQGSTARWRGVDFHSWEVWALPAYTRHVSAWNESSSLIIYMLVCLEGDVRWGRSVAGAGSELRD